MFDSLGVDWGTKKSGVALGNSASFLFVPKAICLTKNLKLEIQKYILQYNISYLIVGLPFNFYGKDTEITNYIKNFITEIKKSYSGIIIDIVNETGTTKESKNLLNKHMELNQKNQKILVDSIAAMKILERYFEQNNHKQLELTNQI